MAEATDKRFARLLPGVDSVAGSPFVVDFEHMDLQSPQTSMAREMASSSTSERPLNLHQLQHQQTESPAQHSSQHARRPLVPDTISAPAEQAQPIDCKYENTQHDDDVHSDNNTHIHPSSASTISTSTSTTPNNQDNEMPPTPTKPSFQLILSFTALALSIFLVALDTVILPTALPTISLSFHIPDSLYAWTGSAYLLANAASVPFWGKVSDVFGRKKIILLAEGVFLLGSVVCGGSRGTGMLVGGRAVQGVGGGGVVVLVHVCVADLFGIRDRSFYLGIIGAVWAVASALGPVLGGIFAEKLDWRWCFFINLPLISLSILTLLFTLHLPTPSTPLLTGLLSLDWPGTLTILAGTLLLLIGLQTGGTTTYISPLVLSFLIIGILLFIFFPLTQRWSERRGAEPIMPLRIFSDVSNACSLGVCACDALVFNSVAYFVPLYLQLVLSISPSTTGIYMLAVAVPLALVSFASGWLIEKSGRFLEILQAGLVIMTLGLGLLIALDAKRDTVKMIAFLVVIGIGFGPNFHAPLIALQTRIREEDIATGTAAFGFVRMVNGAIGVVVGQVVFQLLMKPYLSSFVDAGIPRSFAERLSGGEALAEAKGVAELNLMQQDVVRSGMSRALRGTWIVYTVVSALGVLVSFGIKRKKLDRAAGKGKKVVKKSGDVEVGDQTTAGEK